MRQIILDKESVTRLVQENIYPLDKDREYVSYCSDESDLPLQEPFLMPGGEVGQLATIFSTCNSYGVKTDLKASITVFNKLITTDKHRPSRHLNCSFFNELEKDFLNFNLTQEQVELIKKSIPISDQAGKEAEQTSLNGAVLQVKGFYGLSPYFNFEMPGVHEPLNIFVLQQTLLNRQNKKIVNALLEGEAVTLLPGLDAEYFYEILSDTADTIFFETITRICPGLPLYTVTVNEKGEAKIEER